MKNVMKLSAIALTLMSASTISVAATPATGSSPSFYLQSEAIIIDARCEIQNANGVTQFVKGIPFLNEDDLSTNPKRSSYPSFQVIANVDHGGASGAAQGKATLLVEKIEKNSLKFDGIKLFDYTGKALSVAKGIGNNIGTDGSTYDVLSQAENGTAIIPIFYGEKDKLGTAKNLSGSYTARATLTLQCEDSPSQPSQPAKPKP